MPPLRPLIVFLTALSPVLPLVQCANFPYESNPLTDAQLADLDFPALSFGDPAAPLPANLPPCRALPGSADWPSDDEWTKLNASMGGVLLKPLPAASACYEATRDSRRCNYLLTTAKETRFYIDDPLTVLTEWPQGSTCPLELRPTGNCTQGAFPVYVVNVTSVREVQMAVNFARNKNLRLVIKNTGHDFVGKSAGAGALSVFTHHLKSFEFLPRFRIGQYDGMAARVGAGLEAWELYDYMTKYNMSIVVPAGYTVGPFGGWMLGGGHSNLASTWGLGSDQVLSLEIVTADGRFVTADPTQNEDLFWAMRGGGPGTFGIVTSAIVKAHPAISISMAAINFTTAGLSNLEPFWASVDEFFLYSKHVVDAGGGAYSYVTNQGNDSYSFTAEFELPGVSLAATAELLLPLYEFVNATGIVVPRPVPGPSTRWSAGRRGTGDSPGNSRFATRLFPRANWEDAALYAATMQAVRESVEAGYTFHGIHLAPTEAVAGWPGTDSGVNPAFRTTVMHADVFDRVPPQRVAPEVTLAAFARLNEYMNKIRKVTPGGGAYVNEADRMEPDWQTSFWGNKYPRLLAIKKKVDPWGVFYAPTTVGSEEWMVHAADGLPTQNGPLCRV